MSETKTSTRYELIDKDGNVVGTDSSDILLADLARVRWPDQHQDPDETGIGWNVRVAGCDDPPKAWLDAKVEIDEGGL